MLQKRLDYLDMAKGVGIFFVVLGHIEFIQEQTLRWIFSFHMPLFFIIGGVLAFIKQEHQNPAKEVLKRKAAGTMIPYLSFSLILLSMNVTGYFLQSGIFTAEQLIRQFIDSLTGYGIHILWFLPAYFLANTSFFLLNKYQKPLVRSLCICITAILAWLLSEKLDLTRYISWDCSYLQTAGWNLLIVFLRAGLAQPFILIGWYFAKWLPKVPAVVQNCGGLLLIPGSLLAFKLDVFDLHYLYVQPLHYISAALSVMGILLLMKQLPNIPLVSYLGRNSLIIMCTHASLYVIYYISLGMFFIRKFITMADPVFNLAVAILVCFVEIPMIWVFNRYFGHLLGKSK